MDILIWYTLLSAIVGGVKGARARLGEVLISFTGNFFLSGDRFCFPYDYALNSFFVFILLSSEVLQCQVVYC